MKNYILYSSAQIQRNWYGFFLLLVIIITGCTSKKKDYCTEASKILNQLAAMDYIDTSVFFKGNFEVPEVDGYLFNTLVYSSNLYSIEEVSAAIDSAEKCKEKLTINFPTVPDSELSRIYEEWRRNNPLNLDWDWTKPRPYGFGNGRELIEYDVPIIIGDRAFVVVRGYDCDICAGSLCFRRDKDGNWVIEGNCLNM
ncbi:MAG: hypothetical protein R2809_14095 [Flavobacteriales bacterium]